jgi:GntR family transcriptional regulator
VMPDVDAMAEPPLARGGHDLAGDEQGVVIGPVGGGDAIGNVRRRLGEGAKWAVTPAAGHGIRSRVDAATSELERPQARGRSEQGGDHQDAVDPPTAAGPPPGFPNDGIVGAVSFGFRGIDDRVSGEAHDRSNLSDAANVSSTMIRVKVDKSDRTDLYEQVAGEIRRAIAEGEAQPGERLPPAKDLAAVLDVNTNTVLRALRLLRDEGLLEFRRGRGISVAGTPAHGAVIQMARELVVLARQHGYRLDELVDIIKDVALRPAD